MITLLHLMPPAASSWWDLLIPMLYVGLDYTFRFPVLPGKDNK